MLKKIISAFLAFFIVVLVGCKKEEKNENIFNEKLLRNQLVIKPDVITAIDEANNFFELFDLAKVTQLETTNESLIGKIESIIYLPLEQKIIVLDNNISKSIYVFDLNGKFLNKIGTRGRGEGEYIVPNCIAYENNKLAVFSEAGKLLFYKLDGTFINEINFPKMGWYFEPDKILLVNNDLYCYCGNPYASEGPDGEQLIVSKIKNCERFEAGYGKLEGVLFGGGGLMTYSNSILFTSLFDGNVYEIQPGKKTSSVFASIGSLYSVENILSSKDQIQYIIEHIKDGDFDSVRSLEKIKNVIFLVRLRKVTVIDNKGNIIRRDLPFKVTLPKNYEGYSSRLPVLFFDDGFIICSTDKKNISDTLTPNPSLLFYKFRELESKILD